MPDHPPSEVREALEALAGSAYGEAVAVVFALVGDRTAARWARARPAVVEDVLQDYAFRLEYAEHPHLSPQERVIVGHRAALHPSLAA